MKPRNPLSFLPVSLGFVVLVLSLTLTVLKVNSKSPNQTFTVVTQAAIDDDPVVSLNPKEGTYYIKQTGQTKEPEYTLGVVFDSKGKMVRTLAVRVHFDPSLVAVGPKVAVSNVLDKEMTGSVDLKRGVITIFGSTNKEQALNSLLATIAFRPVGLGKVNFKVEANVSDDVGIVTSKVEDGEYTFEN